MLKDAFGKFLLEQFFKDLNKSSINFLQILQILWLDTYFSSINIKFNCDLCTDGNACFQKVSELNKNIIDAINENNFYYAKESPEESFNIHQKNKKKKNNKNNV